MGDGSRRQAFADRWRGAHPASDTVVRVITVGELVGPDCVRERVQCVAVALEEAAAGEREAVLSVLSCRGWELDPMASVGILSNGEELASREDVVRWLDPDGVFREKGCTPAQEDFALEDVFCGGLWLMMRCGRIRDAVEMVRRSDQPWRELSLLELKHWNLQEPNWHQSKVQRIKRWNWKRACLKLASVDSESISNWEKAVYGLLAGHPEFSDKLCRSVLDILWAHLCCYYENLADWETYQEIQKDPFLKVFLLEKDLEDCFPSDPGNCSEIFEAIELAAFQVFGSVSQEDLLLIRILKYLLSDDLESLVNHLEWTVQQKDVTSTILNFSGWLSIYLCKFSTVQLSVASQNKVHSITRICCSHLLEQNDNDNFVFLSMFLSRNDQIELLSNYCYRTLLPQDVYEFLVNLQSQCEHWETPMSTYTKESVQENLINRVFKDASLDDSIKISTLQTYFNNWEIGDGFDGSEKIVDDFLIVFESLLMEGKIDFSCELARGLEISSSFNFTLIEPWICLWIAYDSVNQYDRLLPSLAENKAEYREELRQRLLELVKSLSNPEYPAVLIRHLPEILIPMLFKCIQFEEPEMALELSQVLSNPESGQRLVSGFSLAEIQNFIFGSAIAFGLSRQRISPPFTAPLLPPSSFHHNQ